MLIHLVGNRLVTLEDVMEYNCVYLAVTCVYARFSHFLFRTSSGTILRLIARICLPYAAQGGECLPGRTSLPVWRMITSPLVGIALCTFALQTWSVCRPLITASSPVPKV